MTMWHDGQTILDEYRVVRRLGAGGMASTYEVRHLDHDTRLAVKLPHEHLLRTPRQRLRFAAEVQVWASMPANLHIVQCFFVREVDAAQAVFCEFVASDTLASWMRRQRLNGLTHALDLAIQWAYAVSVAHRCGVVHRDLKPSNCLMDEYGQLKVCDFGLSAAIAAGAEQTAATGTEVYCSPEQFDGLPTDAATDFWSFGVGLLEMISGRTPSVGPAAGDLLAQFAKSPEGQACPAELLATLRQLLAPDPADRPRSFDDVRRVFESIYQSLRGVAYPRRFPEAAPAPAPAPAESRASSRHHSAGHMMLQQALREAGRDPAEADRFIDGLARPDRQSKAGRQVELALLKEAALIYVQAIGQHPTGPRLGQLAVTHKLIAKFERELGNVRSTIEALVAATTATEQAIALGQNPDELRLQLAGDLHDLAAARRQAGQVAEALATYDRAKATMAGLVVRGPLAPMATLVQVQICQSKSVALNAQHRFQDAIAEANEGLRLLQGAPAGDVGLLVARAGMYRIRGLAHRQSGSLKDAVADYTASIDLLRSVPPGQTTYDSERNLVEAFQLRSAAYATLNDMRLAHADADQAVALGEALQRKTPTPDVIYLLSTVLNNRSNASRALGRYADARRDIDRCIELREAVVFKDGMMHATQELARAHLNRALVLMDMGEAELAARLASDALDSLASLVHRSGRVELRLDLARLRQGRGYARCSSARLAEGIDDLEGSAAEACGLLTRSGFDALGVIGQSLDALPRCAAESPALAARCVAAALTIVRLLHAGRRDAGPFAQQVTAFLHRRGPALTHLSLQHGTAAQQQELTALLALDR